MYVFCILLLIQNTSVYVYHHRWCDKLNLINCFFLCFVFWTITLSSIYTLVRAINVYHVYKHTTHTHKQWWIWWLPYMCHISNWDLVIFLNIVFEKKSLLSLIMFFCFDCWCCPKFKIHCPNIISGYQVGCRFEINFAWKIHLNHNHVIFYSFFNLYNIYNLLKLFYQFDNSVY